MGHHDIAPVRTTLFLTDILDALSPSKFAVASVSPVPGKISPAFTGKVATNMTAHLCSSHCLNILGLPSNRYHGRLILRRFDG